MATVAIWVLFWCIGIIKVHLTNFQRLSEKNCTNNPLFGVNGCKAQSGGVRNKPWEVLSTFSQQFLSCLYALDLQQNLDLDNSRSFFLVVKLRWRKSHSRFVDCKDLCLFQGAYLVWNRQVQFSDSFRYPWKAAAAVVMVLQPIWCILECREWGWIFCLVWSHHEQQEQTAKIQATSFTLQVSVSVLKPILRFFSSLLSLSLCLSHLFDVQLWHDLEVSITMDGSFIFSLQFMSYNHRGMMPLFHGQEPKPKQVHINIFILRFLMQWIGVGVCNSYYWSMESNCVLLQAGSFLIPEIFCFCAWLVPCGWPLLLVLLVFLLGPFVATWGV
jgi:hypothetical protein